MTDHRQLIADLEKIADAAENNAYLVGGMVADRVRQAARALAEVSPPPAPPKPRGRLERVTAPWDQGVLEKLVAWQTDPTRHPYTCPEHSGTAPLLVRRAGFYCQHCDYTQKWAHVWIKD